jgi:hypothetical protein
MASRLIPHLVGHRVGPVRDAVAASAWGEGATFRLSEIRASRQPNSYSSGPWWKSFLLHCIREIR